MTVPDLLNLLPLLREFFPQPIVQEWSMADFLKGEQQQRAATLAGLNAWRWFISPDFSPPPMDDFDDPLE